VGKRVLLGLTIALLFGLVMALGPVQAQESPTVAISVKDSGGNAVPGVPVYYRVNGDDDWTSIGNTDGSGEASVVLDTGTYDFHAVYHETTATESAIDVSSATDVLFTTEKTTINVQDSNEDPLDGVAVYYKTGYLDHTDWLKIGDTSGGQVTIETFSRDIDFHAVYHETTATQAAQPSGSTVLFQTEKTTVQVKDSDEGPLDDVAIYYRTGYLGHDTWIKIGNTIGGQVTIETFSHDIDFHAVYHETTATQAAQPSGSTVLFQTEKTTVQVKNSDEDPIDGVAIYYRTGYEGHTDWLKIGNTTGGQVTIETFSRDIDFHAVYHETTAIQAAQPSGTVVTFNTYKTVVKVKDCDGNGVSDVEIYYRTGYLGHTNWNHIANTDASGQVEIEFFARPAGADFHARTAADWMTATQSEVPIPDSSPNVVTFQMKKVTLFGGDILWQNPKGQWKPFVSPMNMFPRTYEFKFDGTPMSIEVPSGGDCALSGGLLTLLDHEGNGLAGGVAKWADGSWHAIPGQTDADGHLWFEISNPNFGKIAMSYHQGAIEQNRAELDASNYTWQTAEALIELRDHNGNPITDGGGLLEQGGGHWETHGNTDANGQVSVEVFPGSSYKFKMSYNHTAKTDSFPISAPSTLVVFQTEQAEVTLSKGCSGDPHDGGVVTYSAGGWQDFGTTGDDGPGRVVKELFPGTYSIRMTYNHRTNEMSHDLGTPFGFETTAVTLQYSGDVSYAAGSWRTFNKPTMDLLPGTYRFRFDGLEKEIDVSGCEMGGSVVILKLLDSNGDGLEGGTVKYYDGGWQTIPGSTDVNGMLFHTIPGQKGSLKFAMSYAGGKAYQTQDISANSTVVFQTHHVTVELRDSDGNLMDTGEVKYYASGWKDFGTTSGGQVSKELLPLNYRYSMSYAGGKSYQTTTDATVTFQTHLVMVELHDSNGNLMDTGEVKYYASGWKDFGTTSGGQVSKELLPLNYRYSMSYAGGKAYQATDADTVTFSTVLVTVKLQKGDGTGLPGGTAKYYASGWKDLGTTDGNGEAKKELLPLSYRFSMKYGGATNYVNQDIGTDPLVVFTAQNAVPTVRFKDSHGNPIDGAVVKYYASGWKTFGTTDSTGEVTKDDLLPGTYRFSLTYGGGTVYKTQDIATDTLVTFSTVEVTVNLLDSNNNGLSGGEVKYYASGWKDFGTTDGNGQVTKELLPLNYRFRMKYGGGTAYQTQDVGTDPTVTFQTRLVTVTLKTCKGEGIAGGEVKYYASGWKDLGTTNESGQVTKELLPLRYRFRMKYGGATVYETQDVGTDAMVAFTTTEVTFQFGGTIKYYASGWKTFSSPMEMLPGTYRFKFGNDYQYVDVNGCSITQSVVILKLRGHDGAPLAGGTARGGPGGSFGQWHVPGSTDANGVLFDFHDGLYTTMSYEVKYNNTTAHKTQDITVNPVFEFDTNLLTLRLETAGASPLDGGNPRYGSGSTYTAWWFPGGVTGSSTAGETAAEFFPGTYSFEMQYQGTAEVKPNVTIPDADTTLTWQTTNVTLQYSGQLSYGGTSGDSKWFNKPSMELLPGTYTFHFRSCDRTDLTIGGSAMSKSFVCAQLLDSTGAGLAGGDLAYRFGWGSYVSMGTTDASGTILYGIEGLHTNTKFRVSYAGGTTGDKQQNIAADSFVLFQTVPVAARLNDSGGNQITNGVSFQYRYGWNDKQDFSGSKELLPVNTKMTVYYMGTEIEKEQNVGTSPDFVFQTVPVTARLNDSGGAQITNGVSFKYRYGWNDKQDFSGPKELLPVNTKITVYYMGTQIEKEQNVGTNSDFVFSTVSVSAQLLDSGSGDLTSSATFEFRYGWESYQSFSGPMELLPVSTKMRVHYANGTTGDLTQNVGSNANFSWQTGKVTSGSGTATHYRYGWGTFHPFTNGMELLPLSTKFTFNDGTSETSCTIVAGMTNYIH
jgi:hypothetical protein